MKNSCTAHQFCDPLCAQIYNTMWLCNCAAADVVCFNDFVAFRQPSSGMQDGGPHNDANPPKMEIDGLDSPIFDAKISDAGSVNRASRFKAGSVLGTFARQGSHNPRSKINRFNIFAAERISKHTLAAIGYLALLDTAISLSLPLHALELFCEAVDQNMPHNDYHNKLHVADVVQMMLLQTLEDGKRMRDQLPYYPNRKDLAPYLPKFLSMTPSALLHEQLITYINMRRPFI
jgi:hypothetical protein